MKPRNSQASASLLIVLVMATVVRLNAGDLNPRRSGRSCQP